MKKSVCFIEIEKHTDFFTLRLVPVRMPVPFLRGGGTLAERGSDTRSKAGCTGSNRARASRRRPLRDCRRYRSSPWRRPMQRTPTRRSTTRPRRSAAPGSTSPKRGRSPVLQRKMAAKKIVSSAMTTTNRKCSRNEKNDCEPGRYFSTSALICWPKPPSTNERIIISSMPSV